MTFRSLFIFYVFLNEGTSNQYPKASFLLKIVNTIMHQYCPEKIKSTFIYFFFFNSTLL